MSTVSKTKSRDKKVVNDSQKAPSKASGSIGGAYNPLLGTTFQTVESLHNNGRFRNNIDDSDSNCDSASNTGSWSGDSEDHKEKAAATTAKQETIPGADNDKREKMRLKNERKHQRQKEKRGQELHERCCQFLMSRKLEVLVQQVIAMGISHERATYALMLNEGRVEEAISWLFDRGGADVEDKELDPTSGNLKLDISQELGRILELEGEYKCTKQDVEKAVVIAEGDFEKAEESLRRSVKTEDVSDNASVSKAASVQASESRVEQLQANSGVYTAGGEEERKSLGYLRGSGNQRVDRIHMELQWMKMQQNAAMEEKKRMLNQQTRLREEAHYVSGQGGGQFKRLLQREPVMVMQQQQRSLSATTNTLPVSTMNSSFTVSSAAGGGSCWYPANNGYLPTRTLPPNDQNSNLMYQQLQYQQYQGQVSNGHRTAGGAASAHHAVSPAASLGLFSGYGTTSSSGLNWSTDGSAGYSDYNNIDWSLDRGLTCPRPNQAASSSYEANMNGRTRTMGVVQEAALVGNGREWTSPFEGKDLFSLSRQYVAPSL